MSGRINSHRDLRVYQQSCDLDYDVFIRSKRFPKEETYALTDQVRRSSRSVGANISEAWAKRRYPAHFVSKLTDADGELQETRHWIERACAYKYLSAEITRELIERCESIGAMLGKMIANPEPFILRSPPPDV